VDLCKFRKYLGPGVLTAGFAAILAVNWPGQMSYDSVVQLADGRSGHYDSWHPVVMAWLLGLFDALIAGPGLFLAFTMLLLGGAWLILLRIGRPGFGAAVLLVAICLTPQLVLYQATIWKDVLFADAGIAAFAALAAAATWWANMRARFVWLGVSAALFSLAALARQNGALLVPIAALSLGLIAGRKLSRGAGWRYGIGLLAASLVLSLGANFALSFRSDGGAGAASQLRLAQTYDLIGVAKRDPALHFPVLEERAPGLDAAIRRYGVPLYSPRLVDTLEPVIPLQTEISRAPPGAIFAAWRDLVLHHPVLYLKMRRPVFRWVVAPPNLLQCHPDVVGVDGPKDALRTLGLHQQIRSQDRFLYFYVARFIGTPILSHLLFAALAFGAFFLLMRRGQGSDIAIAGLMVAALAFAASFYVISIACDYRYLYFLDLAAMTGLIKLAAGNEKDSSPAKPS
jgi:hypothetical protein